MGYRLMGSKVQIPKFLSQSGFIPVSCRKQRSRTEWVCAAKAFLQELGFGLLQPRSPEEDNKQGAAIDTEMFLTREQVDGEWVHVLTVTKGQPKEGAKQGTLRPYPPNVLTAQLRLQVYLLACPFRVSPLFMVSFYFKTPSFNIVLLSLMFSCST